MYQPILIAIDHEIGSENRDEIDLLINTEISTNRFELLVSSYNGVDIMPPSFDQVQFPRETSFHVKRDRSNKTHHHVAN